MKSAIAAYISAAVTYLKETNSKFKGSISFLLTADEKEKLLMEQKGC